MDIYGIEAQEAIEEYKATLSALQEAKDRLGEATSRIVRVLGMKGEAFSGYWHPEIIKGYVDCWERSAPLIHGTRLLESDVLRERGVDDGQPEG